MALGITEMFGYHCMENFNFPYMTESVSKFWRRWHISLSQWFRDYIYIPMGGSRVSAPRVYFNLLVVWVLTGIWHGAAWNFVFWGLGFFVMIAFEKATGLPEPFTFQSLKGDLPHFDITVHQFRVGTVPVREFTFRIEIH